MVILNIHIFSKPPFIIPLGSFRRLWSGWNVFNELCCGFRLLWPDCSRRWGLVHDSIFNLFWQISISIKMFKHCPSDVCFSSIKAPSGGRLMTLVHWHWNWNYSLICRRGSCCLADSRWAAGFSDDASCATAAATLSWLARQFKLLPSGRQNIIFPSAGLMDSSVHSSRRLSLF